jgi:hypothetical protein
VPLPPTPPLPYFLDYRIDFYAVRFGLVKVIPHLKGLGVMYCIGWGYGRVLVSGDAESSIGRAFSPLLWRWSCDAGDGAGLEF